MDVEGADGRERGEQQDFERKTALFSLAVAEVVVVNMWEHQVGLYQGANMGLLKTVFDVNVQLFAARGSPKTLLVFIIRDFQNITPLENLKQTLTDDLNHIWEGLNKPSAVGDTPLDEFFDLEFVALPHKVHTPTAFESACADLRPRFLDPASPGFFFRKSYHKKLPPADGFPRYAQAIWEKISGAKDLDLPTQQQLLAQYRCDEIIAGVRKEYGEKVEGWTGPVDAGKVVEGLGKAVGAAKAECLAKYDEDAKRYHASVYQRKRKELSESADAAAKVVFVKQLANLAKRALSNFKSDAAVWLKQAADGNFAEGLRMAEQEAVDGFVRDAEESKLPGSDWSFDDVLVAVKEDIKELADNAKKEELERTVANAEKKGGNAIADVIVAALNKAGPELWEDVLAGLRNVVDEGVREVRAKAKVFAVPSDQSHALLTRLQTATWESFRGKLAEETADSQLVQRLRNRFEKRFRYDANGIPRVWKPEDDIDGAYAAARDETNVLVDVMSRIDIPVDELRTLLPDVELDESSLQLMGPAKVEDVRDRFNRDVETVYTEAKRSVINMTAVLPPWAFLMMAVLGWNEFMTIISSPFYFTTFLVVAFVWWFLYSAGLIGAAQRAGEMALAQVLRPVKTQLEANGIELDTIKRKARSATEAAKGLLSGAAPEGEEADGPGSPRDRATSSAAHSGPGGWDAEGSFRIANGTSSVKLGLTEPMKR